MKTPNLTLARVLSYSPCFSRRRVERLAGILGRSMPLERFLRVDYRALRMRAHDVVWLACMHLAHHDPDGLVLFAETCAPFGVHSPSWIRTLLLTSRFVAGTHSYGNADALGYKAAASILYSIATRHLYPASDLIDEILDERPGVARALDRVRIDLTAASAEVA